MANRLAAYTDIGNALAPVRAAIQQSSIADNGSPIIDEIVLCHLRLKIRAASAELKCALVNQEDFETGLRRSPTRKWRKCQAAFG